MVFLNQKSTTLMFLISDELQITILAKHPNELFNANTCTRVQA